MKVKTFYVTCVTKHFLHQNTWKSIFVNFTPFKNLHPIWLPTTPIHSKVPKDDEEDSSTNNECDSCGKSFDTSNYLNRHIYQVHMLGNKNYKCDFCGKSFKQAPNLKKHIRIVRTQRLQMCQL